MLPKTPILLQPPIRGHITERLVHALGTPIIKLTGSVVVEELLPRAKEGEEQSMESDALGVS